MAHEWAENSRPFRHCGSVFMYITDNSVFVKCRRCKQWVNIGKVENIKKGADNGRGRM